MSLRDIAAQAGVHVALIPRYLGSREDLVIAVFDDLSDRVPRRSWTSRSPDKGSPRTRSWGSGCGSPAHSPSLGGPEKRSDFNPVMAMAATLAEGYGLDELSARVRATQIVAAALGWRIFEDYLLEAGDLQDLPLQDLRDDLAHSARRLGATSWPSPPDPRPRHRRRSR